MLLSTECKKKENGLMMKWTWTRMRKQVLRKQFKSKTHFHDRQLTWVHVMSRVLMLGCELIIKLEAEFKWIECVPRRAFKITIKASSTLNVELNLFNFFSEETLSALEAWPIFFQDFSFKNPLKPEQGFNSSHFVWIRIAVFPELFSLRPFVFISLMSTQI